MSGDASSTLRKRLREFRAALGLTQEQLAERATLNYKHYQEIERGGKKEVRLSTLAKIADALQVPLYQLFTEYPASEVIAEPEGDYRVKGRKPPPSEG